MSIGKVEICNNIKCEELLVILNSDARSAYTFAPTLVSDDIRAQYCDLQTLNKYGHIKYNEKYYCSIACCCCCYHCDKKCTINKYICSECEEYFILCLDCMESMKQTCCDRKCYECEKFVCNQCMVFCKNHKSFIQHKKCAVGYVCCKVCGQYSCDGCCASHVRPVYLMECRNVAIMNAVVI
eukprot:UN08254